MADYILEGPKWASSAITWSFATSNIAGQAAYAPITTTFASMGTVFQADITWAFQRWAQVANLQFTQVSDSAAVDIRLGWTNIDGVGSVAGIAYYAYSGNFFLPNDVVEVDASDHWVLGTDGDYHAGSANGTTFKVIALHEIGHALGLDHYSGDLAIMNPSIAASLTDLTQHDINGMQALYGAPATIANQTITGGSGADSLTGGSGNDTITGNGGNDFINGGNGIDTAVFSGTRSQYTINNSGGVLTITDAVAGRNGTDTLTNVEQARFSDYTLVFDLSSSQDLTVYKLYQAAYARTPDNTGFRYWAGVADSQNTSAIGLADQFLAAPEFAQRYGSNPSNTTYVTALYTNVLGRAPDATGLNFWIGQANSGVARDQLLVSFALSTENASLIGSHVSNGYWTT